MARFCGIIGFEIPKEVRPGVWSSDTQERKYYGDITRDTKKWENGSDVNDDLNISNLFSIVADSFFNENLGYMKYLKYMGSLWKIKSVEVRYPRIILTVGGLYNGPGNKTQDAGDIGSGSGI